MNEDLYWLSPEHEIGELVKIGGKSPSALALVVGLRREWWDVGSTTPDPSYLYQLQFCGEDTPDSRWVAEDFLEKV